MLRAVVTVLGLGAVCAWGAPSGAASVAFASVASVIEVDAEPGVAVLDGPVSAAITRPAPGSLAFVEPVVHGTASDFTTALRLDVFGTGAVATTGRATLTALASLTLRNDNPFDVAVGLRSRVDVRALGGIMRPDLGPDADFAAAEVAFDTVLSAVAGTAPPSRAEGRRDRADAGFGFDLPAPGGGTLSTTTGEAFSLGTGIVLVGLAPGEARSFTFETTLAVEGRRTAVLPPPTPAEVPLPAGGALMLAGLGALLLARRR